MTRPTITRGAAAGDVLGAYALGCLAEARAALATDQDEAAAVHAFRKAMKRWRAFLQAVDPLVGDTRPLALAARDLARELGAARDAQAARDALDDLFAAHAPLSPKAAAAIRDRLDAARQEAERVLTEPTRARIIAWVDDAVVQTQAWPLASLSFDDVSRQLARTYRRARRAMPTDWSDAKGDTLHAFRKRVVAHRYQMELVEGLWPRLGKLWIAEAQRLRDRLGANQNLEVLRHVLQGRGYGLWRSRLTVAAEARRARHIQAARTIAERLFAEKPGGFERRLQALWGSRPAASSGP